MMGLAAGAQPLFADSEKPETASDISAAYRAELDAFLGELHPSWVVARRATAQFDWVGIEKRGFAFPDLGWKLHLSISAVEALAIFALARRLVELGASFKLPHSAEAIVRINGGEIGASQVGKIVTVYPRDDTHLAEIASTLGGLGPFGGPDIVGEFKLAGHEHLYLRYGAFKFDSAHLTSRGDYEMRIRLPDSRVVVDDRSLSESIAPPPPLEGCWVREPQVKEISSGGTTVMPLMLLHKTVRGRVFFGINKSSAQACVIKSARRGVAGDLAGFDGVDKLRNEYDVMLALDGLGICAKPIFFVDVGDTSYLVMEDLGGMPLKALPPDQKRLHLGQLTDVIGKLHRAGFVHRDIKEENMIVRDGRLLLTDFELACAIGSVRIPGGGTWGHIPPEGSSSDPDVDLHALGALIAGVELETSMANLPRPLGRAIGLLNLHGKRNAAALIATTALPSAGSRRLPTIEEICGLAHSPDGRRPSAHPKLKSWAQKASLDAAHAAREFQIKRPIGAAWTNRHYASDHICHGINLGAAGIILGKSVIAHYNHRCREFDEEIEQAANWLAAEDFPGAPGLFVGGAGAAISLCLVGRKLGRGDLNDNALRKLKQAADDCSEYELFFGSAGVVMAATIMATMSGDSAPIEAVSPLARQLADRVEDRSNVLCWPFVAPFERKTDPFFGAAHGAAGIAAVLGEWARATGEQQYDDLARRCLLSIYFYMQSTGAGSPRFERRMGDSAFALPAEWCHGAAGFAWALLRAAGTEIGNLQAPLAWAVDQLKPTISASNPSYCHGLAGRLELMMMLQTVPKHREWATRQANEAAAALRLSMQRRSGRSVWSAEDPKVITPDLWVGGLGPATALALFAADAASPLLSSAILAPVAWNAPCA